MEEKNVRIYANVIWAACVASYMAGAAVVAEKVPAAVVAGLTLRQQPQARTYQLASGADLFNPDAAAKIIREKRLMHKFDFDKLESGYKRYAGTTAWVDSSSLVEAVYARLVKAVAEGGTFADWKKSVNEAFVKEGFVHPASGREHLANWHLETIFQTNVLSAYSAANWDMLHHPDVAGLFPKYQIVGGRRARTCEECAALEGIVRPSNDPFWLTHWPPFHYKCSHSILALDQEEAVKRQDSDVSKIPPPMEGFGQVHGADGHYAIGDELAQGKRAEIDAFLAKWGSEDGYTRKLERG